MGKSATNDAGGDTESRLRRSWSLWGAIAFVISSISWHWHLTVPAFVRSTRRSGGRAIGVRLVGSRSWLWQVPSVMQELPGFLKPVVSTVSVSGSMGGFGVCLSLDGFLLRGLLPDSRASSPWRCCVFQDSLSDGMLRAPVLVASV